MFSHEIWSKKNPKLKKFEKPGLLQLLMSNEFWAKFK